MKNTEIINITDQVNKEIEKSGIKQGVCVVTLNNPCSGFALLEKDNQEVLDDVLNELESVFVPRMNYSSDKDPYLVSAISKCAFLSQSKDLLIDNGKLSLDDKDVYVFNYEERADINIKCI